MPAPAHLADSVRAVWNDVVANVGDHVEGPDLEAYCGQVATMREAEARVAREGIIVAGAKAEPIPHPAVEVARKAQAEIRAWGDRFEQPMF